MNTTEFVFKQLALPESNRVIPDRIYSLETLILARCLRRLSITKRQITSALAELERSVLTHATNNKSDACLL